MGNANNVERFRRGLADQQCLIQVPVASATIIAKGDFVLLFDGKAIQPSDLGDLYNTNLAARQESSRMFLGMAMDESESGEELDIRVDISLNSIWNLTLCTAAAHSIADLFGICAYSTAANSWALYDQKIEPDCSYPIMQCVKEKAAAGTDILCKMVQNLMNNRQPSWAADTCHTDSDLSFEG